MNNNDISKLITNQDPNVLRSQLNAEEQALLNTLLNDKAAREKFLSSAEAQKLLQMLSQL